MNLSPKQMLLEFKDFAFKGNSMNCRRRLSGPGAAVAMITTVFAVIPFRAPAFAALAAAAPAPDKVGAAPLVLWYDRPAVHVMNEALAVGNGRMGGLIVGEPDAERVPFNEDSLWTGDENPSGDYNTMGAYQAFGEILVKLPSHDKVTGYRRDLDIGHALAHVSYETGGAHFRRECFCSHPAQVLVLRLTADKPAAYTGSVVLTDAHHGAVVANGNRLSFAGSLDNGRKYEAQLLVLNAVALRLPHQH